MTTRLLPPSDWGLLADTELGPIVPQLDPARTQMLVVEDAGQIVGCWALMTVLHAEGVWIAPAHQGRGSVARRLLRGMRQLLAGRPVMTSALDDRVRGILAGLRAVPVPGDHFMVSLEGRNSCRS